VSWKVENICAADDGYSDGGAGFRNFRILGFRSRNIGGWLREESVHRRNQGKVSDEVV